MRNLSRATKEYIIVMVILAVVAFGAGKLFHGANADNNSSVSQKTEQIGNVSQSQTGVVYQVQPNSVKSNGENISFNIYKNKELQTITLNKNEINLKSNESANYTYQVSNNSYTLNVPATVLSNLK